MAALERRRSSRFWKTAALERCRFRKPATLDKFCFRIKTDYAFSCLELLIRNKTFYLCAIRGNISLSLVRWHHYIATSWNICFLGFKTSLVKVRKTATNTLFLIHFSGITFLSHSVKLFWKDKAFSNYTCYKMLRFGE